MGGHARVASPILGHVMSALHVSSPSSQPAAAAASALAGARQHAYCPQHCPKANNFHSITEHIRKSSFGRLYGEWAGPPRGAEPSTMCDLCAHRWLFVVSTGGRTGSTTLVDMLSSHPKIHLAGENTNAIEAGVMFWLSIANKSNRMHEKNTHAIHPGQILCDLQQWFADIVIPRQMTPNAVIGFKEIRWIASRSLFAGQESHSEEEKFREHVLGLTKNLRFAMMLFPCSKFIFNWRRNSTEQMLRQNALFGEVTADAAVTPVFEAFAKKMPPGRSHTFVLEDFQDVRNWNRLLHWIGETNCTYQRVLHSNKEAYSIDDINASETKGLIKGNCAL